MVQQIKVPLIQAPADASLHIPRSMQWFFLILVALWIFAAMMLPVVAFVLTQNPLCFSLIGNLAPPVYVLYRITRYLFPKSERDYEIEAKKITYGADKTEGKRRNMQSQVKILPLPPR